MKGVAIAGRKGGAGKTTIAHAIALGASWRGVPAHLVHTDDREPIKVTGRPYMYYDARKPDVLEVLVSSAINNDGLFVVDGGGNRPEFDRWIAGAMDLVLIPVTPDPEDVTLAVEHMKRLHDAGAENVWHVINKLPANLNEKRYIARYLKSLDQDRIIAAIPEIKAVRVLREDDVEPFETPPSRVNNLARNLYVSIAQHLDLHAEEERRAEAA